MMAVGEKLLRKEGNSLIFRNFINLSRLIIYEISSILQVCNEELGHPVINPVFQIFFCWEVRPGSIVGETDGVLVGRR